MATPQDIGTGIMPIVSELKRIANALERLIPIQKSENDDIKAIPPIVPPSPISINKGNGIELMHYEGSQLFFNDPLCGSACPKANSCIEYQPGEKCIGWKTRNFRRKDK